MRSNLSLEAMALLMAVLDEVRSVRERMAGKQEMQAIKAGREQGVGEEAAETEFKYCSFFPSLGIYILC